MSYLKAYIRTFLEFCLLFSVFYLILGILGKETFPIYAMHVAFLAAFAGPIRVLLEKK